jgi:hypothetical protein
METFGDFKARLVLFQAGHVAEALDLQSFCRSKHRLQAPLGHLRLSVVHKLQERVEIFVFGLRQADHWLLVRGVLHYGLKVLAASR